MENLVIILCSMERQCMKLASLSVYLRVRNYPNTQMDNSKSGSKGIPDMQGIGSKGSKKGGGGFLPPPVGPSYPEYAGVCFHLNHDVLV
jgi:hypothetical protein